MNKKDNPKTELIRIAKEDKTDLKDIKKELKLGARYGDGDVLHTLIQMYHRKKLGSPDFQGATPDIVWSHQTTLDEYKNQYENQCVLTAKWKGHFERACELGRLNPIEIIERV